MAEYQAQGDFAPTPYANQGEYQAQGDFQPYIPEYQPQGDFKQTPYANLDQDFAAARQSFNGEIGSGVTSYGGPAQKELDNASPFDNFFKSLTSSMFDPNTGGLNSTGSLVASSVLSGFSELFSGAKKDAAARAKQMADAYTLNAQTNAKNSANKESERQNALTSTSTAFGPTSGAAGLIGRQSFKKLNLQRKGS